VAVIQALILAKVIMIGEALRIGRRLEHKPLVYSTLLKTVIFTLFVGIFSIVEHMIKGLWTGKGIMGGLAVFFGKGSHELIAGCLVIFVTFIPFFVLKELRRILGQGKLWEIFFRRDTGK
jgi:hypothetical protein